MSKTEGLTINWNRAIFISSPIDDDLIRSLTPKILALRQVSNEPITVGIDSPGGSLASLDVLLGLLTGPDQDRNRPQIVTVTTHRAYSAAANLLAFGNYSVALAHSQILCHDVRYGGMEDVTPDKARDAANSLQDANDAFALRLAHRVIKRLMWIYIELHDSFDDSKKRFPQLHAAYSSTVKAYVKGDPAKASIDLASFSTALWEKLSRQNDTLIANVMEKLTNWISLKNIAASAPSYRVKGSRIPGLLDGAKHLHKVFKGDAVKFQRIEGNLKLFISLGVADFSKPEGSSESFSKSLERILREYSLHESMNDAKHIRYAADLMLEQPHVFFGKSLKELSDEERKAEIATAEPYARLFWYFCVLLCRELFRGEHILSPRDAQLLGMVDEVAGGGAVDSIREYIIKRDAKNEVDERK